MICFFCSFNFVGFGRIAGLLLVLALSYVVLFVGLVGLVGDVGCVGCVGCVCLICLFCLLLCCVGLSVV